MEHPELSVVVVNWNTVDLTRRCLDSIARYLAEIPHEVIAVDNASADASADVIAAEFPRVRLIRNTENVGFGRANNQAMRIARGDWLLLLNSDAALIDDSVAHLFARIRQEWVGVAQCQLVLPDGRVQHSAYRFPSVRLTMLENLGLHRLMPRRAGTTFLNGYWDYSEERQVDWVAGTFMLFPRVIFEATGGFDERLFMYGEDLEWCYRIRDLGWPIRYYPAAQVLHSDHASADIRWGSDRVALCLQREIEIYARQNGRTLATGLIAVRAFGAAIRTCYYALRARRGGRGAEAYRQMQPYHRLVLRVLISMLVRRA